MKTLNSENAYLVTVILTNGVSLWTWNAGMYSTRREGTLASKRIREKLKRRIRSEKSSTSIVKICVGPVQSTEVL